MNPNDILIVEALKPFADAYQKMMDFAQKENQALGPDGRLTSSDLGYELAKNLNMEMFVKARQALANQPQAEAQPGVGELASKAERLIWNHAIANIPSEPDREDARRVCEQLRALSATPAQPAGEPDMRAIVEALGFDPTNHHNAGKCPYCTPRERGDDEKV